MIDVFFSNLSNLFKVLSIIGNIDLKEMVTAVLKFEHLGLELQRFLKVK